MQLEELLQVTIALLMVPPDGLLSSGVLRPAHDHCTGTLRLLPWLEVKAACSGYTLRQCLHTIEGASDCCACETG